jgi:hypothetical protein
MQGAGYTCAPPQIFPAPQGSRVGCITQLREYSSATEIFLVTEILRIRARAIKAVDESVFEVARKAMHSHGQGFEKRG